MRRLSAELLISAEASANLVVLRTPPGRRAVPRLGDRPGGAARHPRHDRRRRHLDADQPRSDGRPGARRPPAEAGPERPLRGSGRPRGRRSAGRRRARVADPHAAPRPRAPSPHRPAPEAGTRSPESSGEAPRAADLVARRDQQPSTSGRDSSQASACPRPHREGRRGPASTQVSRGADDRHGHQVGDRRLAGARVDDVGAALGGPGGGHRELVDARRRRRPPPAPGAQAGPTPRPATAAADPGTPQELDVAAAVHAHAARPGRPPSRRAARSAAQPLTIPVGSRRPRNAC